MPRYYEFLGGDPVDHFTLGRIIPGQIVELDGAPDPATWKPTKRAPKTTPAHDQPAASSTVEES